MSAPTTIRTIIAHPYSGALYGSPYLWRDAAYAFTHAYSNAGLAGGGWRMLDDLDIPMTMFEDALDLTPGEYIDDRAAAE